MKKLKLKQICFILAVAVATVLTSCSKSLDKSESNNLIERHLEKQGEHQLKFRYTKYKKNSINGGRSGCRLSSGSALEIAKSMGLLNVNLKYEPRRVRYNPDYCIVECSLTSKAQKYLVEENKKWDGATIATVIGGHWKIQEVTEIFEEGKGYRVEARERFNETIFNPYFFRNQRYDTNGGKLYKDGETRTSSYFIQLDSEEEWRIR